MGVAHESHDAQSAAAAYRRRAPEPVDRAALAAIDRLGRESGEDLLGRLIADYLATGPRRLAAMRRALGSGDGEDLARAAHGLAAISVVLRAESLTERCYEVESLAWNGDFESCEVRLPEVEDEYRQVELFLRAGKLCDDGRQATV